MKKKLILLVGLLLILFNITGCSNDKIEGSTITTSVYPIEYLVNRLYGYNSTIQSIYPNDTKISEYTLTDKQLKSYAKSSNLFIYNGLSNEKEIAKTLINKNKNMQIIDVSYGLKYAYGIEELWLNPNNYLMLASTINDNLKELSSSKYTAETLDKNYKELEEDLATLDAKLRNIGKSAKESNKNTIVVAYNSLAYLSDYDFDVINISEESSITNSIKNKFKDKTYKYILVQDKKNVSDSVKDLIDNYNAELIEVNTMETLTESERKNNDNYLTIMNDFINTLSNIVLE